MRQHRDGDRRRAMDRDAFRVTGHAHFRYDARCPRCALKLLRWNIVLRLPRDTCLELFCKQCKERVVLGRDPIDPPRARVAVSPGGVEFYPPADRVASPSTNGAPPWPMP